MANVLASLRFFFVRLPTPMVPHAMTMGDIAWKAVVRTLKVATLAIVLVVLSIFIGGLMRQPFLVISAALAGGVLLCIALGLLVWWMVPASSHSYQRLLSLSNHDGPALLKIGHKLAVSMPTVVLKLYDQIFESKKIGTTRLEVLKTMEELAQLRDELEHYLDALPRGDSAAASKNPGNRIAQAVDEPNDVNEPMATTNRAFPRNLDASIDPSEPPDAGTRL